MFSHPIHALAASRQPSALTRAAWLSLLTIVLGAGFSLTAKAQIISAHPRMILDAATLSELRQRATHNDPDWLRLKAHCDSFIGGAVNFPDQSTYPDPPTLGSEYAGHGYRRAVFNQGLCYQVMKGINASAANAYGDKVAQLLNAMSIASGPHHVSPCTDAGYPIRTYGVAMGIGYDWAHDRLSTALRTQVYTAANAWITSFEKPGGCSYFEYEHPQSNYFAGYFHAKAAIALATYGDNPSAAAQWSDWLDNQFKQRVQPYYATNLAGGGWPEGYANYAPLSILDMSLPMREVKTATSAHTDLVNAAAPFTFPTDSGNYAMHFTWPSRAYFDDRDTNRSNGNAEHPPGENNTGMFVHILGAMRYWHAPYASVFQTYLNAVDAATDGYGDDQLWARFLFAKPVANTAPLSSLPRAYLAAGMGMVAARSDWGTDASWMSFRAGPYVNNPGQGEQYFDAGSLALVRGATPLLLNATGWLVHEPGGTAAENAIYQDNRGNFAANNPYSGNRQIYNVFYVRHMNGASLAEPFGQNGKARSDGANTRVSAMEDHGSFVYTKGSDLADMYRSFSAGKAVNAWTREIVYLRPHRFVVYDRTQKGAAGNDQYLAFHFPANPTPATAPAGETRLDVNFTGKFAGAATFVYPNNASTQTLAMYPSSTPTKVWQVRVRAPDGGNTQRWLSVFDTSSSASAVATDSQVEVTAGSVLGVRLAASDGNAVVIFNKGAAGSVLSGTITYKVPASAARHVIVGLAPNSQYGVSVNVSGNTHTLTLTAGGTLNSSAHGVLTFALDHNGKLVSDATIFADGFELGSA